MTDREKQIFDKYGNYDFPTDIKQKEHNTATTQIEEMAKVLLETSCKGSECENCAFVKSVKEAKETCVCLKALYNAGYRKIPDGAVVLTKEEYEKLKGRAEEVFNEMTERMKAEVKIAKKMGIVKGSKETAEKIYYKAKNKAYYKDGGYYDKDRYLLDMEDLKEIVKSCGVEIED